MDLFRRALFRLVVRLGGLRLIRLIANGFELQKDTQGHVEFPFVRRRPTNAAQILVYHRVNDEDDPIFPGVPTKAFAKQMEYVAEHYTVCSLDETVERIRSDDVPPELLAITFDDGYRDNYTHAFPILHRHGLPATIFLAADAIDSGRMLWHDRLLSALRTTRATALEQFGSNGKTLPLKTPSQKQYALMEMLKFLWGLDDCDRFLWIDRIIGQLGDEERLACNDLMLKWGDIHLMSEHGISFGAHTLTHPILSQISLGQIRQEIRGSKALIESKLEMPVKHFAYPVGRRADFNEDVKNELRDAEFDSAVTTISGTNNSKQDLFELRRATPWDRDIDAFALRLSYFKFASN